MRKIFLGFLFCFLRILYSVKWISGPTTPLFFLRHYKFSEPPKRYLYPTSHQPREGQMQSHAESQPSVPALPPWPSVPISFPPHQQGSVTGWSLLPIPSMGCPAPRLFLHRCLFWAEAILLPSTFTSSSFIGSGPRLPHLHPHLPHMPCSTPAAWRLCSFKKYGSEARKKRIKSSCEST